MSDFQIHYLSECPRCGGTLDDPFNDDLCFQCDHHQHSAAPWDAPDCELCWPDRGFEDDEYPEPEEPVPPRRPIVTVKVGDVL